MVGVELPSLRDLWMNSIMGIMPVPAGRKQRSATLWNGNTYPEYE